MKIGIFGGTFDPIHLGHLRTVEEAALQLGLQRTFMIPSARPPHKPGRNVTDFRHRMEMTRLGAEDNPLLQVLDLEGTRSGPSYSVDTLESLRLEMEPGVQFHFMLGMDAFLEIESWHRYRRLFHLTHFVIINRPGDRDDDFRNLMTRMDSTPAEDPGLYVTPGGNAIRRITTTLIDISSTEIRRLVRRRGSIRYLVTEPVRRYISREGLYLNGTGA